MEFIGDLMEFHGFVHGHFMEFNGDLMGFYGDLIGFMVI